MNKRHLSRVEISEWASVRYHDKIFFGDLKNLSFQGMYFATDQTIPVNTLVSVDTPYSQISLNANVVRQDQNGVGLKIADIKLSSFLNLKKVILNNFENSETYVHELQYITLKIQPPKIAPDTTRGL